MSFLLCEPINHRHGQARCKLVTPHRATAPPASYFGTRHSRRASGPKPTVRRLGRRRLPHRRPTKSRAIPIRGECPENRPTNPAALAAAAIRFDTARPERRLKTRALGKESGARIARSAAAPALPNGQGRPTTVLITLGAVHGDPGGPVTPHFHVGLGKRGDLGVQSVQVWPLER